MFTRRLNSLLQGVLHTKSIHTTSRLDKYENPFWRTINILRNDFSRKPEREEYYENAVDNIFPRYVDILVIGGGAMGSSIAYWIKEKTGLKGVRLTVIEKDHTYAKSSTVLSVGGLRQQFSLPENIQMSLFGAEFIRNLKKRFGRDADVYFTPNGYLTLASEQGAQQLLDNSKLQRDLGACNVVLSKSELKARFPWINVDDVEAGCLGLEKEGWFDPWAMLCILKKGAMEAGARYITGEVVDFLFTKRHDLIVDGVEEGKYESVDEAIVKLPNGDHKSIQFSICIIASGADSGDVAKLARIGTGEGMLAIPLPVEKRKRYVYCFECKGECPGINTPLTIDYTGTYFRRESYGGTFIGGLSPLPEEEPPTDNMDVDHTYFDEKVWPVLAHRVPAFNSIKVRSAWSGFYDYNRYDENGIIGPHPYYHNLYIATGFSGHGIQQAPAVGRAISELILDGDYQTIGLNRFGFDRLIVDKPMLEAFIVLLNAVHSKERCNGSCARYITGEVVDFLFTKKHDLIVDRVEKGKYESVDEAIVKFPNSDHKSIQFSICIIASGADSGDVAKLARIGTGEGMLAIPSPVEKRKRYEYCFECKGECPGINIPLTIYYTGTYFRRESYGGTFIGGLSPLPEEEPPTDNMDVDHTYFDEKVWPVLAHRVPAFNSIKVRSAWSGFYDYNRYDENGIIGPHPYYHNLYIATGFSGHGIQQAPAVGRAISELILDGDYQTIGLNRFGFDRLIVDKPMLEAFIV